MGRVERPALAQRQRAQPRDRRPGDAFQLPLQIAWISTAIVGIAIVAIFH